MEPIQKELPSPPQETIIQSEKRESGTKADSPMVPLVQIRSNPEDKGKKRTEFYKIAQAGIKEFLQSKTPPSPEKVELLAQLLDHCEENGTISGSDYLRGLVEPALREVGKRLYILSSERLRKGNRDDDFIPRIDNISAMQVKDLSPRLIEDALRVPPFDWPSVWPQGWPTPGMSYLGHRGDAGRLLQAVVEFGEPASLVHLRSLVEASEEKTARVLLWALGHSANAGSYDWFRSYIEQSKDDKLKATAIVSINRIMVDMENDQNISEEMKTKAAVWHAELRTKGWLKETWTMWD